jgi:hypothetical protein
LELCCAVIAVLYRHAAARRTVLADTGTAGLVYQTATRGRFAVTTHAAAASVVSAHVAPENANNVSMAFAQMVADHQKRVVATQHAAMRHYVKHAKVTIVYTSAVQVNAVTMAAVYQNV